MGRARRPTLTGWSDGLGKFVVPLPWWHPTPVFFPPFFIDLDDNQWEKIIQNTENFKYTSTILRQFKPSLLMMID